MSPHGGRGCYRHLHAAEESPRSNRGRAAHREADRIDTAEVHAAGSRTGSTQLREWALRELKGYAGVETEDMPGYRIVTAPLYIDGFTSGHPACHPRACQSDGDREAPSWACSTRRSSFGKGISEIESLAARDDEGLIAPPGAADLAMIMNADPAGDPNSRVERIYWSVAPVAIRGVDRRGEDRSYGTGCGDERRPTGRPRGSRPGRR